MDLNKILVNIGLYKENIVPYYLQEIIHKRLVADKVIYLQLFVQKN